MIFIGVFFNLDIIGKIFYFYYNYYYIDFLYGRFNGEFVVGSNVVVIDLVVGGIVFLKFRQFINFYFGILDEVYCIFLGYKLDIFKEELVIGNLGEIIG